MTGALVVDLDGVVLLRDVAHRETLEVDAGMPPGALLRAAFSGDSFTDALTGTLTDEQWRTDVADRLAEEFGEPARVAVARWSTTPGIVDTDVLTLLRRHRTLRPVALLTNSTDRLPQELAALGLDTEFDAVFSSADLGVAKPDPAIFRKVQDDLPVDAYVDDSATNVEAASAFGWRTHHYRDVAGLAELLDPLRTETPWT